MTDYLGKIAYIEKDKFPADYASDALIKST